MAAYIGFQPSDYFNTKLYTGNSNAGSTNTQSITGVGFQPDFTWIKNYQSVADHVLFDSVRGATKFVNSNQNSAEQTVAGTLTAFDADGFTLGTDLTQGVVNNLGNTFVSWNWKGGTTSGLSGGTITPSAYSFNTTSGCSIIQYTGNGVSGATIPHGLGVTPEFIMIKVLPSGNNWRAYQGSNTPAPPTEYLSINGDQATADDAGAWNDTAPTSTLITLGNMIELNNNGSANIAYAFAPVKGYSHFGVYIGNGNANGPFVYTGFRPAWLMIKRTDDTGKWIIMDSKRQGYNMSNKVLYANANNAQESATTALYSNGFKVRETWTGVNANTGEYIYAAFAEFPFVSSNSKAGTAR